MTITLRDSWCITWPSSHIRVCSIISVFERRFVRGFFFFKCMDCWVSWIPIISAWYSTCSCWCYRLSGTNTLLHKMLSSQRLSLPLIGENLRLIVPMQNHLCRVFSSEYADANSRPNGSWNPCRSLVFFTWRWRRALCRKSSREPWTWKWATTLRFFIRQSVSPTFFWFHHLLRKSRRVIYSLPCLPSNSSEKNHLPIQSPAFGQVSTKPYIPTGSIETATHAPGVG